MLLTGKLHPSDHLLPLPGPRNFGWIDPIILGLAWHNLAMREREKPRASATFRSISSFCHAWITTTNFSFRFPIVWNFCHRLVRYDGYKRRLPKMGVPPNHPCFFFFSDFPLKTIHFDPFWGTAILGNLHIYPYSIHIGECYSTFQHIPTTEESFLQADRSAHPLAAAYVALKCNLDHPTFWPLKYILWVSFFFGDIWHIYPLWIWHDMTGWWWLLDPYWPLICMGEHLWVGSQDFHDLWFLFRLPFVPSLVS